MCSISWTKFTRFKFSTKSWSYRFTIEFLILITHKNQNHFTFVSVIIILHYKLEHKLLAKSLLLRAGAAFGTYLYARKKKQFSIVHALTWCTNVYTYVLSYFPFYLLTVLPKVLDLFREVVIIYYYSSNKKCTECIVSFLKR